MKIQIFSDVHLEFGPYNPVVGEADLVIAAGDIGVGLEAVDWLESLEKPVIYVAGNHELYRGEFFSVIAELKKACAGTNIHFLERDSIKVDDITFLGCTLWTPFGDFDSFCMDWAYEYMNDYAQIMLEDRELEPEDVARYNEYSMHWLKGAIAETEQDKQVVITHHAPSLKSWGFDPQHPKRFIYCNELDEFIRSSSIAMWVHGHVHCYSDYNILDTRVVCNPRGYNPHRLVEEFQDQKVVEI